MCSCACVNVEVRVIKQRVGVDHDAKCEQRWGKQIEMME